LPTFFESEGGDRPHMQLPGPQAELIRAVAAANPRTAVVINAGAPVAMPWVDAVPAILEAYYPGQENGAAVANILFGEVNPSGKLPVSFPARLEDNPAFGNYPGLYEVHYGEGIFVGYRWYDNKDIAPLFPFGHGLSYTTFEYSDLKVSPRLKADEDARVTVRVSNTGPRAGKEVAQLYVADKKATLARPPKELKGFQKVELQPGESKTLTFTLDQRALSFYDPYLSAWVAEPGEFEVLVGSSSRDIRVKAGFVLE
jgi:beta-glucosidase